MHSLLHGELLANAAIPLHEARTGERVVAEVPKRAGEWHRESRRIEPESGGRGYIGIDTRHHVGPLQTARLAATRNIVDGDGYWLAIREHRAGRINARGGVVVEHVVALHQNVDWHAGMDAQITTQLPTAQNGVSHRAIRQVERLSPPYRQIVERRATQHLPHVGGCVAVLGGEAVIVL